MCFTRPTVSVSVTSNSCFGIRAGQPCVRFTVASCAPQPLPPRASPPAACGCRRRMRRTGKRWGNQLSTKYAYVPLAGSPRNERKRPARTRRRCSGRICCRHPVCCSWQHCCWAGRMIGDGCLVDNVWNEESSSSKHANVFFCSSPGTSAWKGTSWKGRPCTRSLLRRGCPPRSRPRRLRFGA